MSRDEGAPLGYDEIIEVVEMLPELVRDKRRREGLSLRKVEEQTGMSASTVLRFEQRLGNVQAVHLITLLKWVSR